MDIRVPENFALQLETLVVDIVYTCTILLHYYYDRGRNEPFGADVAAVYKTSPSDHRRRLDETIK